MTSTVNVAEAERWTSALGGAALGSGSRSCALGAERVVAAGRTACPTYPAGGRSASASGPESAIRPCAGGRVGVAGVLLAGCVDGSESWPSARSCGGEVGSASRRPIC